MKEPWYKISYSNENFENLSGDLRQVVKISNYDRIYATGGGILLHELWTMRNIFSRRNLGLIKLSLIKNSLRCFGICNEEA